MKRWTLRLLLSMLLAACASVPAVPEDEEHFEETVSSFAEGCQDERSVVLLCQGPDCGFFLCRDVMTGMVVPVRGGGVTAPPPAPGGSPRRWQGPSWLRRAAPPVLTFRFHSSLDVKPPRPLLPPGRYVRHHIFPQADDLARWFEWRGVPIHNFTLVIPEHIHWRIHSGGPRGGLWNAAWRKFRNENPRAPPEEIYRHAGELIYRFELMGPVVTYRSGK